MSEVPIVRHLIARRFWRPLAQTVLFVQRPMLRGYDWLFTERRLERACFWLLSPLPRLCLWLCRKAGQARAPQPFRHSSIAYDIAAVCTALLEPFAKWHSAARRRMKDETDPRLRDDDKPANRNGEHKHDDHEQR